MKRELEAAAESGHDSGDHIRRQATTEGPEIHGGQRSDQIGRAYANRPGGQSDTESQRIKNNGNIHALRYGDSCHGQHRGHRWVEVSALRPRRGIDIAAQTARCPPRTAGAIGTGLSIRADAAAGATIIHVSGDIRAAVTTAIGRSA